MLEVMQIVGVGLFYVFTALAAAIGFLWIVLKLDQLLEYWLTR